VLPDLRSADHWGADSPMPRTFAYVPRFDHQPDDRQPDPGDQAAGFKVEQRRVVTETISGSVATAQRRGFTRLLDRPEPGDVLIVTKLDRLGRNAMDVSSTVAKLAGIGVRVLGLALGGVDLASSTGKLTMLVINAVAEFERDLLIERKRSIPVVLMSSVLEATVTKRCSGYAIFMRKPFRIGEVIALAMQLIPRSSSGVPV
jgi:Resolvase, N terminal domain